MNGNYEATGGGRQEVRLDFRGTGLQILGWGLMGILAFLPLALPAAWFYRAYAQWFTRNIETANRYPVSFHGKPEEIWYWMPLLFIAGSLSGWAGDGGAGFFFTMVQLVLSFWVSWRVTKWFLEGVRVNGVHAFRFTADTLHFSGWQLLAGLSFLTIIGWAWVGARMQHWIYRHLDSPDMELEFHGAPTTLLKYGLLFVVLPLSMFAIATTFSTTFAGFLLFAWIIGMPWMAVYVMTWMLQNTRLILKSAEPVSIEAPIPTF